MFSEEAACHRLLSVVERFQGIRVWVAGDLMLDEYADGEVQRISPEGRKILGIEDEA